METDKELAMQLVDSLEEYYRRWTLMKTLLDSSNVRGWRRVFDELLPDPEMKERVQRIFQPVRDRVLDAPDLSTAVRQTLRDIPGIDPRDSA